MPRRVQPSDVPGLASLYHSVWHETHSAFMPVQEIARRTLPFFLARMSELLQTTIVEERDASVAGFASWSGALLGQIYVAAPFRGSSLATELMQASEREMAHQGIGDAELHCVVGNERARRFYERMGWKHSGEILEKVAGPTGNADVTFWRMRKRLV